MNQEKALVGAFSVIVQQVVEPMDHFTALIQDIVHNVLSITREPQIEAAVRMSKGPEV